MENNEKMENTKLNISSDSSFFDFEKLTIKEIFNLLLQYNEDIDALKIENNNFKQQIDNYQTEIFQLKEIGESRNHILFYDFGTIINHNDEWNDANISMVRSEEYTSVFSNSGKWFEPIKNNNNFFLPSKFRVDLELIEYNPSLKIILSNINGELLESEIGYSENFGGKGHLSIIYDNGDLKTSINGEIINKKMDLGNDGISIRFDMWAGEKLKFKEFIIQTNLNQSNNSKIRFCPICGNFSEFLPVGNSEFCPKCKSLERHRFVYLLFKEKFKNILSNQEIKLLHFAPEKCMYDFFSNKENIDYFPVDLNAENFGVEMRGNENMESISYDNDTFDIIYHCHVLEHVPKDITAMSELYRVLKPNGFCVILVPINFSLTETLEKEEYNTPELREKYYGQHDHLRYYAMDIVDKLEYVGFHVETVFSEDLFDFKNEMDVYKIAHDVAFVCKK